MSKTPPRLGRVQLQIMEILWRRGQATAREITDEMSRRAPVAHSTIQTLLRKLEAKGAVDHEVVERSFVFRPLVQHEEVAASAARDLMARVFHGSLYGLVAQLLRHERISPDELKRLRALIDEAEKR